jgi:toxin ParE1/3/4
MNHVLIIQSPAEQDMKDAFDWYEKKAADLGDEFLLHCEEAFARIAMFPMLGAELEPNVRKLNIHKFPYSIYYRIGTRVIDVFGVLHNSRDPELWRIRLDLNGSY